MNRSKKLFACCYWLAAAIAVLASFCYAIRASHGAMADCIDATCRITAPDGSRGTGCVFEISHNQVYVLTAAHVVARSRTVACEFWRQGHQSQPLEGRVLAAADEADVAIVAVPQASFGAALPAVVPLASRDHVVRPGETLTSVGCAGGNWATGWKGHALRSDAGELRFVPAPANGRSGSAIFDAEGSRIVGIVSARTAAADEGIASSVQAIYRALDEPADSALPTQCGPNGCPPRTPATPNRLLPLLPLRQTAPSTPYPTLPAPGVDVKPLDDKLGRIEQLLGEIRSDRSRVQPGAERQPPAADPSDPQARKLATDALDAAKAAQADAARLAQQTEGLAVQLRDVAVQNGRLGAAQEKMTEAIQRHGTIGERIEMLKQRVEEKVGEDASRPERLRAFVHEAVTDKTEWLRIGLVVAFALPLLIFVIDFAHHKKSGDPLLIEKLALRLGAAAVHQPLLAPAANVVGHAAQDVTGLLALLSQQAQRQTSPTVVVTPPAASNPQNPSNTGSH